MTQSQDNLVYFKTRASKYGLSDAVINTIALHSYNAKTGLFDVDMANKWLKLLVTNKKRVENKYKNANSDAITVMFEDMFNGVDASSYEFHLKNMFMCAEKKCRNLTAKAKYINKSLYTLFDDVFRVCQFA